MGRFSIFHIMIAGQMCLLCPSHVCFAGAWPTAQGQGQVINTASLTKAAQRYDENGHADLETDYNKQDMLIFVEYGLTDKTTVVLNSAQQSVSLLEGDASDSYDGIGESAIGIRHAFWQNANSVLSGQVSWVFGDSGALVSDAPFDFGMSRPEYRVLYGRGLTIKGKEAFLDTQLAWRQKREAQPGEWHADITAGIKPSGKTQVLLQTFYVKTSGYQDFVRPNTRLKFQPSLVYQWSAKTSFQLGGFSTIAGKNTVKENGIFLGMWMRYGLPARAAE